MVLVGLLALIAALSAGVWLAIAQPWDAGDEQPQPTPSASASPHTPVPDETEADASPTPEPTTAETPRAVPCTPADVEVVAVADAETYPAGALPKLSISLTNRSNADCTIDVGTTTQSFTITSGSDVWWRSTDCQENPSSMVVTLSAGQTVTSAEPVEWDRTRSSVDTCDQENRARAPGGGASYHVAVSIGGFDSRGSQQILLY